MTNRWTWLVSVRYSVDWVALLVFRAGWRLFCTKEREMMEKNNDKCMRNYTKKSLLSCQKTTILTFPVLLIFFASSIKRWGTIQRFSDCAMSTLVKWQHWAAIRTWAVMSFLSVGWTNRGGKNDGAVMVATLWIDILLKLCRSTTSLKKLRSSRIVLRFSCGNKRHRVEIARVWSWAGSAEERKKNWFVKIIKNSSSKFLRQEAYPFVGKR